MQTQKRAGVSDLVKGLLGSAGSGLERLGTGTARVAGKAGIYAPARWATISSAANRGLLPEAEMSRRLKMLGGATLGAGALGAGGLAYGGSKLLGGGKEEKEAAVKSALDVKALLQRLAAKVGGGVRSATGPGSILRDMTPGALTGAAVGAGTGALTSEEGERGRGALRGALGGGVLGAGTGLLGQDLAARSGITRERDPRALGLLGGGAAGGAIGGATMRAKKKEKGEEEKKPTSEKKEEKKEAAFGTPFTDGFLVRCMQYGLDGEQVATMLEKGAGMDGRLGQECKDFLDRLAKA